MANQSKTYTNTREPIDNSKKVVNNLVWALSGKIVNLFGNLLVGIFVARYLGPEQYGLMNYVISYVAIFQVLASFGLDQIEIREEASHPELRDKIIGTAWLLRLFFAAITYFLVLGSVFIAHVDFQTRIFISIYALSIIFSTSNVARNYFSAIVWNEYVVKTEIIRTLIGAGIKLTLLLLHMSIEWFIGALLFDAFMLFTGYLGSYSRVIDSIKLWKWDKDIATMLIRESFPMLLSGAAIVIYQRIDQVMIGKMLNLSEVGQYSIAASFVEISLFIPTIITQTITPILITARNESSNYQQKAQQFMDLTLWGCIIIAIFICLISFPLIRYTYGAQYLLAVPALQILIFKLIGVAAMQTSGALIIIEGKQKWASIRNGLAAVCCVGCNLILIPSLGIIGSAISGACSLLVAGWLANLFIPEYRTCFHMLNNSFISGWRALFHIKSFIKQL